MRRAHVAAVVLALGLIAGAAAHAQAQPDEATEGSPPPARPAGPGTMRLVVSYALALGGLATVAVAVLETFQRNLSYPSAKLGLINLLRTAPNNAEMVCRSMPGTFYEPLAAAFKTGAMLGRQDVAVLATATRPAYDGGAMAVKAKWKTLLGKAKLGAMAASGGLAVVGSAGAFPLPIVVLVVLVLAGMGWLLVHKAGVERTIVLARAEILPELERALASGRYVAPPS